MEDAHLRLIRNLSRHVFGEDEPSTKLLKEGRFPPNWVTRYVALVESVTNVWAAETVWPREMVAAIHFASFYLEGRYRAWQVGGGKQEKTEQELNTVRGVSEAFLLGCTSEDLLQRHSSDSEAEPSL